MLRYIYVFFVGLFLAIFVGMGIAVFYQAPSPPQEPVWPQSYGKEPTAEQIQQQQTFEAARRQYDQQMWRYNRNVSMIVLVSAVVILAIALLATDRIGLIADGMLLGGIFTLLYGVGRGMATDSNRYRFLVAAIGLAITIILGYVKFGPTAGRQAAAKKL